MVGARSNHEGGVHVLLADGSARFVSENVDYNTWQRLGARRAAPADVLEGVRELSKERTYVLYCDVGVQTAPVAEILQRLGYQVYSFRGGTRGIARHEREKSAAGAPR